MQLLSLTQTGAMIGRGESWLYKLSARKPELFRKVGNRLLVEDTQIAAIRHEAQDLKQKPNQYMLNLPAGTRPILDAAASRMNVCMIDLILTGIASVLEETGDTVPDTLQARKLDLKAFDPRSDVCLA